MADFINTIDVLGDDAVIDSIIDRSITEFKDNTLTAIGRYAFYNCTALKTVDLPNVTIITGNSDNYAFGSCTSLEEVNLPLLKTIEGTFAFSGSKILGTLNLPELETAGNYTLRYCQMTNAVLPKITSIGNGFFQGCSNLEKVDFSTVTSIGGAFEKCNKMVALIIRTPTVCTWGVSWGLPPTVASGTCYIYVPSALVDSYKAATNWSTYAAQFRALEDYTVDGTTTGELDETKI